MKIDCKKSLIYFKTKELQNEPGHWDIFISYTGRKGEAHLPKQYTVSVTKDIVAVGSDKEMNNVTEHAMKLGVKKFKNCLWQLFLVLV